MCPGYAMCLICELIAKCVLSLTTRNDLSRRDSRNDLIHLNYSEPTHRPKIHEGLTARLRS